MKILSNSSASRFARLCAVGRGAVLSGALALGLAAVAGAQPAADAAGAHHEGWGEGAPGMHPGMQPGMHPGMGGGMDGAMGGAMGRGMRDGMHRGMDPRMMHRMLEVMHATPEQRAQVRSILEKAHADLQALRSGAKPARDQMRALFEQPTIDAKAAESLRQQMSARRDQIGKRMLQARIDVANVFTPAQRQTLVAHMKEHRALLERQRAEREAFDKRAP